MSEFTTTQKLINVGSVALFAYFVYSVNKTRREAKKHEERLAHINEFNAWLDEKFQLKTPAS